MSFGKKSSNKDTTPQPVITPVQQAAQQPIERTARTAAAADRAAGRPAEPSASASLLQTEEDEMQRRRAGSTF